MRAGTACGSTATPLATLTHSPHPTPAALGQRTTARVSPPPTPREVWRPFTDKAVGGYLDCGVLENGFVRVRCGACHAEFLVAFSCKGRGLCPSCAAKRAAALAAFLREEVLADVAHAQWVFSIPKMLRASRSLLAPPRRSPCWACLDSGLSRPRRGVSTRFRPVLSPMAWEESS